MSWWAKWYDCSYATTRDAIKRAKWRMSTVCWTAYAVMWCSTAAIRRSGSDTGTSRCASRLFLLRRVKLSASWPSIRARDWKRRRCLCRSANGPKRCLSLVPFGARPGMRKRMASRWAICRYRTARLPPIRRIRRRLLKSMTKSASRTWTCYMWRWRVRWITCMCRPCSTGRRKMASAPVMWAIMWLRRGDWIWAAWRWASRTRWALANPW